MTTEIVQTIRNRRKHFKARISSDLKVKINLIRREIVLLTYHSKINSIKRLRLQKELADLKHKLNQLD